MFDKIENWFIPYEYKEEKYKTRLDDNIKLLLNKCLKLNSENIDYITNLQIWEPEHNQIDYLPFIPKLENIEKQSLDEKEKTYKNLVVLYKDLFVRNINFEDTFKEY